MWPTTSAVVATANCLALFSFFFSFLFFASTAIPPLFFSRIFLSSMRGFPLRRTALNTTGMSGRRLFRFPLCPRTQSQERGVGRNKCTQKYLVGDVRFLPRCTFLALPGASDENPGGRKITFQHLLSICSIDSRDR